VAEALGIQPRVSLRSSKHIHSVPYSAEDSISSSRRPAPRVL